MAAGSCNWFRVVCRFLATDKNGRLKRMIGMRLDISESKRV